MSRGKYEQNLVNFDKIFGTGSKLRLAISKYLLYFSKSRCFRIMPEFFKRA